MPSHVHVPGCARLNVARLNAFRLDAYEPLIFGNIDDTDRTRNFRIEGAAVDHVLNDAPDTAAISCHGFTPVAGQRLSIYSGDRTVGHQLFGGRILQTTVRYESKHQNVAWDLQGIDPTWLLNRTRVLYKFVGSPADAIVRSIVLNWTRGVTTTNVQAGLPVIDEITFTNETVATCLTAICERIGGYWYLDYTGDLHVFLTESVVAAPITEAQPQGSADHQLAEDLSQVVTKVIARGTGVGAAIDVVGGATEIPIDLGDQENFYTVSGGLAEVAAQRISYTGVRGLGGLGAFIGTGNAPSVAPAPTPAAGSSHTVGATYGYAATFTTAAGETLPGPLGAITIKTITMVAPPAVAARSRGPNSYPPGMISAAGGPIRFAVQIVYNGGAWGPLGTPTVAYAWDGYDWEVYAGFTAPYLDGYYYPVLEPNGPVATVNHFIVYRSDNYQPWQYATSSGFVSGGWVYQCCAGYSSGTIPAATGFGSVLVKQIPVSSATGVTGRKLYRTTANGAALKLLGTLANNTATDFTDTVADGALGAAPPTLDTSTIKDEGTVLAGATALPVSSTTPFAPEIPGDAAGGWAQIGDLVIKYTGLGAGTLTGLPASGPGALTATVRYGAQVLRQPRLVGVAGLTQVVRKGETVALRIEISDTAAQDALAARFGSAVRADGVVEEVFSDSRMTLRELQDYAEALLADRKDPRRTLTFTTRDPSCQVGRLITVTLTTPPISGTFRIQRIRFSEIAITGGLARVLPKRTVEASNKLFTFADLLRRLRGREGGAS
jgi:hypothetical protein